MHLRLRCLLPLALSLTGIALSQEPCGEKVIPVNVALTNGQLLRQLPADVFAAEFENRPISVAHIGEDSDPRRVVVVMDTGDLDREVRRAEQLVVRHFIEQLRPEDKVALTTVRGIRRKFGFENPGSQLDGVIADIGNPKGKRGGPGLAEEIQTVLMADNLKAGDAVLVVAEDFEPDEPQLASLQQTVLQRGIRVIAFQLGPRLMGTIYHTAFGSWSASANDRSLAHLAFNSGGYMVNAALWTPQSSYKLGDSEAKQLQTDTVNAARAIAKFYKLRFEQPPVKKAATWTLDLRSDIKDRIKKDVVTIYPRVLLPCIATSAEKKK
jgi:hypothetical protein